MKKEGKPVDTPMDKLDEVVKKAISNNGAQPVLGGVDFSNTEIAFSDRTDAQLKKAYWLFQMMNKPWLVNLGTKLGIPAVRLGLPLVDNIVRSTIFQQFCGGRTLLETQKTIERLAARNTSTVLDFGAEGKKTEEDLNRTMNETLQAIEYVSSISENAVVSSKFTGMARFGLLEKIQSGSPLTEAEQSEYDNVLKRVDSVSHAACQKGVTLYVDAEESWIQDAIDGLVNKMMARYNTERPVVFNTYQLYRHDRLQYLMDSFQDAQKGGYFLGAKLVRGAYMEKERRRAAEMGYPSPIYPNKAATDDAYNTAIRFCLDHFDKVAVSNSTHNADSNMLMARLIVEKGLPKNHVHLNFAQLYGMSDNITFNLANSGFNVSKYVPYGEVRDVIPYLMRRAKENTSVTGDMSRELSLIDMEVKRRGLA
ncbi:MAG: proline dehydrogenase family protein [Saprospirales bacterium]|nr:proline dehydrogenase family protein [Saprospirales bacterium]